MTKTLEEKRAYVKEHLLTQAKTAFAQRDYYVAGAAAEDAFGRYCEARASEEIDEVVCDLMIEQWEARSLTEALKIEVTNVERSQRVLDLRWERPIAETAMEAVAAWAVAAPDGPGDPR